VISADVLSLSLEEVIEATGARRVRGAGGPPLTGLSTDTRHPVPGGLFIGLRGERFDGSSYGAAALEAGAGAVVVSEPHAAAAAAASGDGAVLAVDDTTRALGLLARWHRRRTAARVVGVTGSNGKTTTKEMLAAVLSAAGETLATEGNLNNEIGVPLTLLRLRPRHRYAVIEMGMNHEGEIGRLAATALPEVGVVTCAAAVHVEALGSVEGVSRAKGELFTGLALDGVAVANADDPLVAERARWAGRRTLWFGQAEQADVRLVGVRWHDHRGLGLDVSVEGRPLLVTLPVVGLHNAYNACAALAAALALGLPVEPAVAALRTARPPGRRLRLSPMAATGASLLDDCYNANPASSVAALQTLAALVAPEHRLAVLGDLRELGDYEAAGHREVGVAAAEAGLRLLVAFGPASRHTAAAALEAGLPAERIICTDDPAEAAARVRERLSKGDLVLVKASRGTRLERVSDLLAPADPLIDGSH